MKKKACALYIVLTVLGLGLLALGLVLLKSGSDDTAVYLCIGLGCGIFGHGCGELIGRRAVKNHPEIAKQREIERSDERNTALKNRAAATAFRMMIYVFGALFVAFALMNVELRVILLLVFAYLLVCGCYVCCCVRYDKEM